MVVTRPTAVQWNQIAEIGYPPAELWLTGPSGGEGPRKFLVRGVYTLDCAYMHSDGSGFNTDMDEPVVAWAVVEGF